MTSDFPVEIVTSAITAASGLIGVFLGAWLTIRATDRHGRAEARLSAYNALVGAGREFLWRGDEVGTTVQSDVGWQAEAVREAMRSLRGAVTAVSFLGPAPVRAASHEVLEYFSQVLYEAFRSQRVGSPRVDPALVKTGNERLMDFQNVARAALGLADKP